MTTPNGKHEFEAAIIILEFYDCEDLANEEESKSCKAAIAALKDYDSLRIELAHTKERAKSLESELEKVRKENNLRFARHDLEKSVPLITKLARFAPLIEAARGVDKRRCLSALENARELDNHDAFWATGEEFVSICALLAAIPEDKP